MIVILCASADNKKIKLLDTEKAVLKNKYGLDEAFNNLNEIDNKHNKLNEYNPRAPNKNHTGVCIAVIWQPFSACILFNHQNTKKGINAFLLSYYAYTALYYPLPQKIGIQGKNQHTFPRHL